MALFVLSQGTTWAASDVTPCSGVSASGEEVRFTVGLRAATPALAPGDAFVAPGGEEIGTVVHVEPVLGYLAVTTSDPEGFRACLATDPKVRYVEPSAAVVTLFEPDDPTWGTEGAYGPGLVGAPALWDRTAGRAGVSVCVADTGVRATHEDLAGGRYLGGFDFVLGKEGAEDDNGHGTHVTATIAASTGNGKGIAGMAQVAFRHAKVMTKTGGGFSDVVASGIRWCADEGSDVISVSLESEYATALREAVDYAWAKGALVVAAAGNSGKTCKEEECVAYPANFSNAVAVGCVDARKKQCDFSSRGSKLDVVAPGHRVLSASADGDAAYATKSGTSMSAPHVAGAAALLKSLRPSWSNFHLRAALESTAEDLGAPDRDPRFGRGLVRVDLAADAAPVGNEPPVAWFSAAAEGLDVAVDASASRDRDGSITAYVWDWGDGTSGSGEVADHVYEADGTYTVELAVVDDRGATRSVARTIAVQEAPVQGCLGPEGTGVCLPERPGLPEGLPIAGTSEYESGPDCAVAQGDADARVDCQIASPLPGISSPDELAARYDAEGECGAPGAEAHYVHEGESVADAATPCPQPPADPRSELDGPGTPDVPTVGVLDLPTPSGPDVPAAPGRPDSAAPPAPDAPVAAEETLPALGRSSVQAGGPVAPVEEAEGDLAVLFHRPVEDDGSASDDFVAGPVEAAEVDIAGPVSVQGEVRRGAADPAAAKLGTTRDAAPAFAPRDARPSAPPSAPAGPALGDAAPRPRAAETAPATSPVLPAPRASASVASRPLREDRFDAAVPLVAAGGVAGLLAAVGVALYHRVCGPRASENPRRARILEALREKPGLGAAEVAAVLGVHLTTAAYHLRVLETAGAVASRKVGGRDRYVLPGTTPATALAEVVLLDDPLPRGLLDLAASRPGLTIGEAAKILGRERFAVGPQVRRLKEAKLLVVKQDGTARRLYAAPPSDAASGSS